MRITAADVRAKKTVSLDAVAVRVRKVLANAVEEGMVNAYDAGRIEVEIIANIVGEEV